MLVQVSSSFFPVLEHEVFAHKGTNNTIFTTLPKPAEMWQCIQLLICGSSAFFGLLAAKTFPKLSNIRTEPDHTLAQICVERRQYSLEVREVSLSTAEVTLSAGSLEKLPL